MEVFVDNDPFTRNEFYSWIQNSFGPHLEDEKVAHGRMERVYMAMYGDGNGDSGVHADVKKLMCIAMRVEHWLNGTALLWKITVAIVTPLAVLAGVGKTM